MTQCEMTEKLSEKCDVTLEEARAALETGEWNVLTATHLLDREKFRRKQELDAVAASCAAMVEEAAGEGAEETAAEAGEEAAAPARAGGGRRRRGMRNLGDHLRRLMVYGNRNRFEVCRNGARLLELPMTVLVILLLCSFGSCALLLAAGLFAGCRYSIRERAMGVAGV